jgi:hypothetical protein
MKLEEIIESARRDSGDTVGVDADRKWSLEEWAEYANDAENILCEELLLITDSQTPEICTIPVTAGVRSYAFDSRILQFDEVRYSTRVRPLDPSNVAAFADNDSQWRTATGEPDSYALDDTTGYICLNKIPTADATIYLSVKRSPLVDLTHKNMKASPEIKYQYHKRLKNYMLHKAFSKPDAETLDVAKSSKHFNLWLADKSAVQDAENRLKKGTKTKDRGYFS